MESRPFLKICKNCGYVGLNLDFPRRSHNKGWDTICLKCSTKRTGQWIKDNRERSRSNARRVNLKRHGWTPEEFETAHAEQNGLCAICSQPSNTEYRLDADHCHRTGRKRGLLCRHCNLALGLLDDDIPRVEALLGYLKKYGDDSDAASSSSTPSGTGDKP